MGEISFKKLAWENKEVRIIGFLSKEARKIPVIAHGGTPKTSPCVKPAGIYLP